MSGHAVVRHVRGSVAAQDIARILQTDGVPLSSRGKGRALFKAALPVPASGDICIEIPRHTADWASAGAATFAMCSSRKVVNVRCIYDPMSRHISVDPWQLSMTWLAEFCEDLSARLWGWRPLVLPWEHSAISAAQDRLGAAMNRWSMQSPALFRLAVDAEKEGNLVKLSALCHADAVKSTASAASVEDELASCRLIQLGVAVNPAAPVSFRRLNGRIITNAAVRAAVEELVQTRHDDLKSAAIGAAALLAAINDSR